MLVLVMQCLFVRSVLKHSWEWIGIGGELACRRGPVECMHTHCMLPSRVLLEF